MKKRILSAILALCLVLSLGVCALAADNSRSYEFNLTANGKTEINVETGDVITVMLELKRTSGDGPMYAMQDEINYDSSLLRLSDGGELLYTGCRSTDIALTTGGRSHYLNFLSAAGGENWGKSVTVGTFKLEVIGGKATTVLKNANFKVSTKDGSDTFTVSAQDVIIRINGSTDAPDIDNGGNKGDNSGLLNRTSHIAYVSGYPDGTVRPGANITRAETAQMLYRLLTSDAQAKYTTKSNSFSDVAADAWYCQSVSTLSGMGIITGYPDGTFRPNANITRAEFATLLSRFTEAKTASAASFTDTASHWARNAIETASANGWVTGYPDGTFRPNNSITRAEAMTMINRMLGRLPETEADLLTGMTTFSDNSDTTQWYYLHVQEATNSQSSTMMADGVHESWTRLG